MERPPIAPAASNCQRLIASSLGVSKHWLIWLIFSRCLPNIFRRYKHIIFIKKYDDNNDNWHITSTINIINMIIIIIKNHIQVICFHFWIFLVILLAETKRSPQPFVQPTEDWALTPAKHCCCTARNMSKPRCMEVGGHGRRTRMWTCENQGGRHPCLQLGLPEWNLYRTHIKSYKDYRL